MKYHRTVAKSKAQPVIRSLSPLFWFTCCFAVVLSLLGAAEVQWGLRAFGICFASAVFVPFAIYYGGLKNWHSLPTTARLAIILFASYCLIQIIPLPPGLWQMMPGQETRLLVLEKAGLAGSWMPISLTPVVSIYGALLTIAVVTMILVLVGLRDQEFLFIGMLLVSMVVFGIFIGSVQVATAGSISRFYRETDAGALVGLYANKNHMALAIACSIVMANFIRQSLNDKWRGAYIVFVGYWIFAAMTLPLTNSRAGLMLGVLVSLVIAWPMTHGVSGRQKWVGMALFVCIVPFVVFLPLPQELATRFGDVAADVRWPILNHSLVLWRDYWLFGAGLGSFADVFVTFETPAWLFEFHVNNVHNDYVQVGIETGVVGMVATALFGYALVRSSVRAFGFKDAHVHSLALMGFAISLAFALHSLADYPLRRPAALIIFIFACAAVFRAASFATRARLER